MTKQQKEFGWSVEAHRERDQVIAGVCLPNSTTVGDGSVSKSTVMLLLYRLNHHAWGDAECFPGHALLAKEMGLDRKTVGRAVEAAVMRELLTVEKKKTKASKVVCNHYAIRWDTLARMGIYQRHPEALLEEAERGDMLTQRPPERGDMRPGALGHTDPGDGSQCPQRGDILTHDNGDGGCKTKRPPPPTAPSAHRGEDGGGVLDFCWGRRVDPSELHDPEAIDRLYEIAIVQGAARPTESDRLAFFALVAHFVRVSTDRTRIVGLLTSVLAGRIPHVRTKSRDWRARPQNCDEDQARRWLDRLDREDDTETPAKIETAEESRARQIAALGGNR